MAALGLLLLPAQALLAAAYYVAPNGDNANPGTLERPFATVQRAQEAVFAGDTVYVRGGTYVLQESQIARKQRIWAYVTFLDKSGAPENRINYWAYKDERPVFDLSNIKPEGLRVTAFFVTASWVPSKASR